VIPVTEEQFRPRPILGWVAAGLASTLLAAWLANSGLPTTVSTLITWQYLFIATVAFIAKAISNRMQFPLGKSPNTRTLGLVYGRRLAILMFATGFGVILHASVIQRFGRLTALAVWFTGGLPVFFLFVGGGMWILARRITAIGAPALLDDDQRAPVLFLRAFKSDSRQLPLRLSWIPWKQIAMLLQPRTIEEVAVAVLHRFGPVIAIGRPGQRLAPLGAAREYVDQDWRSRAVEHMRIASLIVIVLGHSAGVSWEIDEVLRRGYAYKCLFIAPSIRKSKRRALWRELASNIPQDCISYRKSDHDLESVLVGFVDRDESLRLIHRAKHRSEDYESALQEALSEVARRELEVQDGITLLPTVEATRLPMTAPAKSQPPRLYLGSHAGVAAAAGGMVAGVALMAVTARRLRMTEGIRLLVPFALLWDLGSYFVPDLLVPLYNGVLSPVVTWTAGESLLDSHVKARYEIGAARPWHATAVALGFVIAGLKISIYVGVTVLLNR
jgi:hypothetical protein